jgi:hypothetical protein
MDHLRQSHGKNLVLLSDEIMTPAAMAPAVWISSRGCGPSPSPGPRKSAHVAGVCIRFAAPVAA